MKNVTRRLKRWIGVASVLAVMTSQANAWGPLGHKAVALLAERRLSPQTLAAVRDLLGGGVRLDAIANCADALLHTKKPADCGGAFTVQPDTDKTSRPWHFVDIELADFPGSSDPTAASLGRYCPNGEDCVIEQIRRQTAVLGDPRESRYQRQLALMFLVHFVGDEHQPLHCADDDDRGGNKKSVIFQGKRKNLHSLWDGMIRLQEWQEDAALDPEPLVRELEADMRGRDTRAWASGNFIADAAIESFKAAKSEIYPRYYEEQQRQCGGGRNQEPEFTQEFGAEDLHVRRADAMEQMEMARRRGRGRGRGRGCSQELGDGYQREMQPLAKERIGMAGVRLAALLEQALGTSSSASMEKRFSSSQGTERIRKVLLRGPVISTFN